MRLWTGFREYSTMLLGSGARLLAAGSNPMTRWSP